MVETRTYIAYEFKDVGELIELNIDERNLIHNLASEKVLLFIREDLRRIFIWKGAKSSVKTRFMSSKAARELQAELMKDPSFHH